MLTGAYSVLLSWEIRSQRDLVGSQVPFYFKWWPTSAAPNPQHLPIGEKKQ